MKRNVSIYLKENIAQQEERKDQNQFEEEKGKEGKGLEYSSVALDLSEDNSSDYKQDINKYFKIFFSKKIKELVELSHECEIWGYDIVLHFISDFFMQIILDEVESVNFLSEIGFDMSKYNLSIKNHAQERKIKFYIDEMIRKEIKSNSVFSSDHELILSLSVHNLIHSIPVATSLTKDILENILNKENIKQIMHEILLEYLIPKTALLESDMSVIEIKHHVDDSLLKDHAASMIHYNKGYSPDKRAINSYQFENSNIYQSHYQLGRIVDKLPQANFMLQKGLEFCIPDFFKKEPQASFSANISNESDLSSFCKDKKIASKFAQIFHNLLGKKNQGVGENIPVEIIKKDLKKEIPYSKLDEKAMMGCSLHESFHSCNNDEDFYLKETGVSENLFNQVDKENM